jgi:hypothetical protein
MRCATNLRMHALTLTIERFDHVAVPGLLRPNRT